MEEHENIPVKATMEISDSIDMDGNLENSATIDSGIELGNLEAGISGTASETLTADGREYSMEMEASAGMEIAEGMTWQASVNIQSSGESSETEEAFTQGESGSIAFQSRIEVDPEKATLGKEVVAGTYNAVMGALETGINSMLSTSSETEIPKEESPEEEIESYSYDYGMGY